MFLLNLIIIKTGVGIRKKSYSETDRRHQRERLLPHGLRCYKMLAELSLFTAAETIFQRLSNQNL